ncbi:hypothetical protein BH10PLA2_BH10PLA2_28750 [soil metagenome]
MKTPKWVDELLGELCDACVSDVKGRMSGLSCRYARPSENALGDWLLLIAPSAMEIAGGQEDGSTGFDFVDVDLLALPGCLDEVESFAYDSDFGNDAHLTLLGKKGKRDVVVKIYFEPFGEDEPSTVFDANACTWREKKAKGE